MRTNVENLEGQDDLPVGCIEERTRFWRAIDWIWCCVILLVMSGCASSEPAIAKGNVKLVEKLRVAVMAKNEAWLEATAKQIDTARQRGMLSDGEYAALEPIVSEGRRGEWDDANARMVGLIEAQRH
jgi:hypothetical protein